MRVSRVDIAATFFALLASCALGFATFAFVDSNDVRGIYFLTLGAAAVGASLKIARTA